MMDNYPSHYDISEGLTESEKYLPHEPYLDFDYDTTQELDRELQRESL